jgi:hypothetical protein
MRKRREWKYPEKNFKRGLAVKTLRTFKWKFLVLAVIAAGAVTLILKCANPVDDPPLKWLSKIEFPVTNDSFNIGQKLPELMNLFNDTIVKFWYRRDSLPWYRPNDTHPVIPVRHARYFSANTITYTYPSPSITWQRNHVYEWTGSEWDDLGEVIDILKGGIDSTEHTGIFYYPSPSGDPRTLIPDYIKGDTVVLSLPRTDSNAYPVAEDAMEDKFFHPSIGLITISGAPLFVDTLPVAAGGPVGPVAYNMPLDSLVDLVIFDPSSPPLPVKVTNLTGATVTNLALTIFDSTRTTTLGPFGIDTLYFPTHAWNVLYGRDTGNAIGGGVVGMQIGYANADAATQLQFSVDPNGLVAGEITAQYSVIGSFQKSYTNDYELTDTLDVKYIDLSDGMFMYVLYNYTNIDLGVDAEQLHLWNKQPCVARGVDSAAAINGKFNHDDSCIGGGSCMGYYRGKLTSGFTDINKGDSLAISATNLAADRLFPLWNDSIKKSVSRVVYTIRTRQPFPYNKLINIKSTDSLLFVIRAPSVHFWEMSGVVTQEYVRGGETAVLDVSFPFNKESIQSLRDNFKLSQVLADIYLIPRLPDSEALLPRRAFLGNMRVEYVMYNPAVPSVTVSDTADFTNIINNRLLRQETDITPIMNTWPESLYITSTIRVPVGTWVRALNEQKDVDADYTLYMGRMNIGALTLVRANLMFGWRVWPDTAKLDLGYGTFPVPGDLKSFNRLENPLVSINMNVFNNTNLYMYLHGLVAPQPRMQALRSMPRDTVRKLISDTASAHQRGYISLLGPRGVRIPARGTKDSSNIILQKWEIDTMAKYDTCGWRWEASFIPMAADTLRDTDYVFVQSWLHLEGINDMDSLLLWK